MSIGHPGESDQTVTETKQWLLDVKPEELDVTIITPYPGSPYYDEAIETQPGVWTYTYKKTGDRLHAREVDYNVTADYYKGDPNGGYHAFVYTDHLSSEQIVALRTQVEEEVRAKLNIKFNPSTAALRYEHSMGQGLPDFIHRKATGRSAPKPMTPAWPDLQHFPSGHVARRVVSERDDLVD
jgi:anaerobic magnesium-protoporphyrin IX monomethyl ester cyclase